MNRSKVFDNNHDFIHDYLMNVLGESRDKWIPLVTTVPLRNKTTSQVEFLDPPASEEGGLFSVEEHRIISWEELAANYTFIDDTPCIRSQEKEE